ncbi:MAG: hypothetical protein ACKVUT_09635 [Gaiella sp.]
MIPLSRLDEWTHGLDPPAAGSALLALGLKPARRGQTPYGPLPPIRHWSVAQRGLNRRLRTPAGELLNAFIDPGACRVAVGGDLVTIEVARRLRAAPSVVSAFAAVAREPGSLRHRPWSWPLRIGLLGFAAGTAEVLAAEIEAYGGLPGRLVDVRRLEDEPAAVDILVVDDGLADAAAAVVASTPVANAVIVAGELTQRWPVVEALLGTIRAATGATAAAIVPHGSLGALGGLVREMSHALPFDMAAAAAWGADLLLWGEPDRYDRSRVPEVALRRARELRSAARMTTRALPPSGPAAAAALDAMAEGAFAGETHEASGIAEAGAEVEAALEAVSDERWLQAQVNRGTESVEDNAFARGDNEVLVFVGPPEEEALRGQTSFDERKLPWREEDADAFRLTVVFAPLEPRSAPQTAQIELPRFGRSQTATFHLDAPDGVQILSARIAVVFRNRILQTAVLSGVVGEQARLDDLLALVTALGALDERRPFDAALLANHDRKGLRALLQITSPRPPTFIDDTDAVLETVRRLSDTLSKAADVRVSATTLTGKSARTLLVSLAVDGRELNDRLPALAKARRIQVVTAGGDWYLPIELAYEREAPNEGATVCENFLRDPDSCGPACANDLDVVCPNAFWGLSRTIERHRFDPGLEGELGARIALVGMPRAKRRTLTLERAVLGASARVRDPGRSAAVTALGAPAVEVASWDDWQAALADADTHLLVLLPHTNYADPSLEISGTKLLRGRIEQRYVTGGRTVEPVVLLFGCRTSGARGDPSGFASRFMMKDAAIVFHSLADLKAGHAAVMAERMVALLRSAREHVAVSELLTRFRREAVHSGLLAGLAVSAYGDADWRV